MSSRVMTLTAAATSLSFCSYLDALVTVVPNKASRLSSALSIAADGDDSANVSTPAAPSAKWNLACPAIVLHLML